MYNNNNINSYNYYPQSQPIYTPSNRISPNYNNQQFTLPNPIGLRGRPVTSLDEVRAASIDFDGSIFYFPDLANQCIYSKQINADGTATIKLYELKQIPSNNLQQTMNNSNSYVTREEFENFVRQFQNMVKSSAEPVKQEMKTFN